jgi:predicted ribosome quality control (RQC) complex YloA/Tae2 family protein
MSLSSSEITKILDELPLVGSFIQQVIQPTYPKLYVQLHQPGATFWIVIDLEPGNTRLHKTNRGPKKPEKPQRFESFLKSRIKGGKILSVEHIHQDRIIRIEVIRDTEITHLYLRLWSSQSNCIVTDEHQNILEAQYRRPGKGETFGQVLPSFQAPIQNKRNPIRQEFLQALDTSSLDLNELVDRYYYKKELNARVNNLIRQITRQLLSREASYQNRFNGLEQKKRSFDLKDRFEAYGELLKTYPEKTDKVSEVEVNDWWNPGQIIRIALDPAKTVLENSQTFFHMAKKAKSNFELVVQEEENLKIQLERIQELTIEIQLLQEQSEQLEQSEPLAQALQRLEEIWFEVGSEKSSKTHTKDAEQPGLVFQSMGYTILVGRNSKENDGLLRHYTKGNDYWLHTRDYPGGYVFIKHQKGKTIPLDVLLDAGNLALHYSKAKTSQEADLYYTQVKYLRRPKYGKQGLVLPTQEKNLHIQYDDTRIQRLLGKKP